MPATEVASPDAATQSQDRQSAIDIIKRNEGQYATEGNDPAGAIVSIFGLRQLTDSELAEIAKGTPHLKFIDLPGGVTGDGLAALAGLADLEHVKGCSGVPGPAFAKLQGLDRLRAVEFVYPQVGDADLAPILALPHLEYLSLWGAGNVTDEGVRQIAANSKINRLVLHGVPITDKSVEALSAMKGLKYVDVWDTKITDDGAAKLRAALPEAEVVK